MARPPTIQIVATFGILAVGLAAVIGADAQAVSGVVTTIVLWMLPGAIIAEMANGFAKAFRGEFLVPLGLGAVSGASVALVFRVAFWLAGQ